MPDYGHDLRFGTFLTPRNDDPQRVVGLAQLSEQAGLDLVTFQDHPYQPAFLDTWTLLSWVAASTSTIHVAPNVLNLPLRPPAVVARAAASLDLLSGGRFDLGLGAGGFPDAIAAMGGPKRTPGESVTALDEAIDVLHQIWDTATRGGVRVQGEHYVVKGAKRGPEPAHDIPIWLGAYKPRMLRLTGRKADGWLPSLQYLDEADILQSTATIDEAATKAGRDPREIRRLLNITAAELTVERLLPFVLEHGFGTFILASDDPDTIRAFGEDVAPALRSAVEDERRSRGTDTGSFRSPSALAQRLDGIDYDGVPAGVEAVEPGDRAYPKVQSTYVRRGRPRLVLRPETPEQVADALAYARRQPGPLAVRSGGHGLSGRSTNDGGLVLDVGRLDGIELLDHATGRLRVGPGARWGDIAQTLQPHGLAMSSGDYGDVGVGGLATTAGVGFLGRRHGLTIDHVVAAEVVLADGSHVRADAQTHPDLFWALRGAGGNVGIVTALELEAYPVGDVVLAVMAWDARDTAAVLERWGTAVEAAPRELTSFLHLTTGRRDPVARAYTVFASADTDAAVAALTPLLDVGPLLQQQAQLLPYAAVVPPQGLNHPPGPGPFLRAGLAPHLDAATSRSLAALAGTGDTWLLQVRQVGGAINDVPADATAYAHRTQSFSVSAAGYEQDALNRSWDAFAYPHMDGLYLSFDTDTRPERIADAFPPATLARLRALKARYDPDNVFDQNFPIPPADLAAAA
jgi:alkanesulfonate monooxygenase SsuD/methylene tetrahydromethanopterin reductase-like flavin-dependent oxidoreductase (luciferase family)